MCGWVGGGGGGGGCLKFSDAHDLTFMHLIHLVHIMQLDVTILFPPEAPKKTETQNLRK